MFGRQDNRAYVTTGTTRPIWIPRGASPKSVQPGQGYFFVKIHSAQAAFTGHVWEGVKGLLVTSQVNLNHPALGNEAVRAIQRSRKVEKNRAEQLGLNPNLISLVPASMTHVSISVEFILDKENYLARMAALINDDSFFSAVSLAPGTALVVKTIGDLAQKVIQTFIPAQERDPILQFSGDFNLDAEDLKDGYYVILGTRDEKNPIPDPLPQLGIQEEGLLADGQRVTQLSYVVLDVRHSPARTRDRNDNAPWEAKLREAEGAAELIAGDKYAENVERRQTWDRCKRLLQEARVLLTADQNYLRTEADLIWKSVYDKCVNDIAGGERGRDGGAVVKAARPWRPDSRADRDFLGIPLDEDLGTTLDAYAEQVVEARRVLTAADF